MAAIVKSSYKLRNKFKAQIENLGLEENFLDKNFDIALKLPKGTLKRVLWNMIFKESLNSGLKILELSTNKEDNTTYLPEELVRPLANELRWQYTTTVANDFLIPKFQLPCYEEIYSKLLNKLDSYAIIAYEVQEHVKAFLNSYYVVNQFMVEKTINLLQSRQERYVAAGLKNLKFRNYEINYLLEKGKIIGSFLSEYYQLLEENEGVGLEDFQDQDNEYDGGNEEMTDSAYTPATSTPFQNLNQMLQKSGFELPDGTQNQSSDSSTNSSDAQELLVENPISPAVIKIMAHVELVDDFISIYNEVLKSGLDPQYLIEKKEAVSNLLDGYFGLLEAASENL